MHAYMNKHQKLYIGLTIFILYKSSFQIMFNYFFAEFQLFFLCPLYVSTIYVETVKELPFWKSLRHTDAVARIF